MPTDLPSDVPAEQAHHALEEHRETFKEIDLAIDKIDTALPLVRDLEAGDSELDDLATMAKDNAQQLLDLGMNMEARFSGTVFQTAGVLLGHAITAKQAKLDKKLRMVDLQLKKMRLDHQIRKDLQTSEGPGVDAVDGEGVVLDRNALLAQILGKPQS